MKFISHVGAALVAGCMAFGVAHAAPITVSAGETVLFNFDFVSAGASPPPPYDFVIFGVNASFPTDPGLAASWTAYADLNGQGAITGCSAAVAYLHFCSTGEAAWTDGIFSIALSVTAGSLTLNPDAIGTSCPPTGPCLETASIQPTVGKSVPEPATVTLFGLALAGLGFARKRTRGRQATAV